MRDQNPKSAGVYAITHLQTGLVYVGAAVNIAQRWAVHRYGFRKGKHHSKAMQRLWSQGGEEAFAFSVLEYVSEPLALLGREQYWLDTLATSLPERGFNTLPYAHSTCGRQLSQASRDKIRAGNLGKKHTAEAKAKISASLVGRPCSEETKAKIKARLLGRVVTAEMRANIGAASRGRVTSAETKAKIAAALAGRKSTPAQRAALDQTGRFHSAETKAKISAAKRAKPPSSSLRSS